MSKEYNDKTSGIVKLATRIVQEDDDAVAKLVQLQADEDTQGLIEFFKELKDFIGDIIVKLENI